MVTMISVIAVFYQRLCNTESCDVITLSILAVFDKTQDCNRMMADINYIL